MDGTVPTSGVVGKTLSLTFKILVNDAPRVGEKVTLVPDAGTVKATEISTDASGRVTVEWTLGTKAGAQTLKASAGGISASGMVTATADKAAVITLSSDSIFFDAVGDSTALSATVKDQHGNAVTGPVGFLSNGPSVATLAGTYVKSAGNGSTTITVTADTATRTAKVVVRQAIASVSLTPRTPFLAAIGDTVKVTATLKDRRGVTISGTKATFGTSNPSIVLVDTLGNVVAAGNGAAYVRATATGVSARDSVPVSVVQAAAIVTIAAPGSTLAMGDSAVLTATVRDSRSVTIAGAPVTWTTGSLPVATISPTGLLKGAGLGTTTITATSGSASANVPVTVTPAAPSSLVATPGSNGQSAVAGAAVSVVPAVTVKDRFGNLVPAAQVRFLVTAGGGTLGEDTVGTNPSGVASPGSWSLGTVAGHNELIATVAGVPDTVLFVATGLTGSVSAPGLSVGSGGGTVQPSLAGSGVDGLTIAVPPGAYSGTATFTVSSINVPSLPASAGTPLAALHIDDGGQTTDSIITIRVPLRSRSTDLVSPYWYAPGGGLEPIPAIASDDSSITFAVKNFAKEWSAAAPPATPFRFAPSAATVRPIVLLQTPLAELLASDINTGFQPGVDDWEFYNQGSVLSGDGICLGQVLTAAWYFENRKALQGSLFNRYAPPSPIEILKGADSRLAYRLASVVQSDYLARQGADDAVLKTFQSMGERYNLLLLLEALKKTGPQLLFVTKPDAGLFDSEKSHVVIAYYASMAGKHIRVADPNRPDFPQYISFDTDQGGGYSSFTGAQYAGGDIGEYTIIRYVPREFYRDLWTAAGNRWTEFEQHYANGSDFSAFPTYDLVVTGGDATGAYAEGMYADTPLDQDEITVWESTINVALHNGGDLDLATVNGAGVGGVANGPLRKMLPLLPGKNTIAAIVTKPIFDQPEYVDVPSFTIFRRALRVAGMDGTLVAAPLAFQSGVGRSFKLRFDQGTAVPQNLDYSKVDATTVTSGATVAVGSTESGFTITVDITEPSLTSVAVQVLYLDIPVQTITANVSPVPVATVVVTPGSAELQVGDVDTLVAELKDSEGNVLTGRTVTWSSSNPAAATVGAATGILTGVATGETTITASAEGKNGTATVTVVPRDSLEGYTLEIAYYHEADFTTGTGLYHRVTLSPGDPATIYRNEILALRLKKDGEYVTIHWDGNIFSQIFSAPAVASPRAARAWKFQGPPYAGAITDGNDELLADYSVNLWDLTNNQGLSFPIELTLSNAIFGRIVGNTIVRPDGGGVDGLADFYTVYRPDFIAVGTRSDDPDFLFEEPYTLYQGVREGSVWRVDCGGGNIIDKRIVGAVSNLIAFTDGTFGWFGTDEYHKSRNCSGVVPFVN